LIFALSCPGLVMGIVTVCGAVRASEGIWGLMVGAGCAAWLVKRVDEKYFRHGFMVGWISSVMMGLVQASLFPIYASHHPEIFEWNDFKGKSQEELRLMVLVYGMVFGIFTGLAFGLLSSMTRKLSRMNWKLILLLSGFGLVMGSPSIREFTRGYEFILWILILISCVSWIVGHVAANHYRYGYMVGLIGGTIGGAIFILTLSPETAKVPLRQVYLTMYGFLMAWLVFGIPQGVLLGGLAWVAAKSAKLLTTIGKTDLPG